MLGVWSVIYYPRTASEVTFSVFMNLNFICEPWRIKKWKVKSRDLTGHNREDKKNGKIR